MIRLRSFPSLLLTCTAGLLGLSLLGCGGEHGEATASQTETPPSQVEAAPAKMQTVGYGQPVELADLMTEGQITIFDFYSDYCGPCRQISPYLERLNASRDDITVVKVDINRPKVRGIDWGSPLAKQFKLRSIPHFKVYDQEGQLMGENAQGQQLVWKWLKELDS